LENRESLRIGEVAGLLQTSTNTIRYYHEVGLLPEPERTEGGYRLYDADDVLALRRIRWLRSLGLPIREAKKLLSETDRSAVREAFAEFERQLSERILELEDRREQVRGLLKREDLAELLDASAGPYAEDPDAGREPWRASMEELEAEYPPSPEEREQTRLLERTLGAFRWPPAFRLMLEDFFRQLRSIRERDPEGWARSTKEASDLARRFSALRGIPENSPEVDRLVADYAAYLEAYPVEPELEAFAKRHEAILDSRLFGVASKLALGTFSPAQRRFFSELEKRAASAPQETEEGRADRSH
jgi:DNA-binding transcriptional MerR regulator